MALPCLGCLSVSVFSSPLLGLPHALLPFLGNLQSSVTFELTLDPGRLSPRATFKETNTRTLTRVQVFELSRHCETLQLLLRVRQPQLHVGGGPLEASRRLGREGPGHDMVLSGARPQHRIWHAGSAQYTVAE